MLSHFATVKTGDKVVDLGTGTGVIPLIISTRIKKINIIGVEIQEELAEMATRSVQLNSKEETITIVKGDLQNIYKVIGGGMHTLVTANPPYWSIGEGKVSALEAKALARHEIACSLESVVACASKLLTYQGRFALIYRAERLLDVLSLLRQYKLEPRRLRFVHPFIDRAAKLVLVEARKSAGSELKALPPLIVYESPGIYTREILGWYGKEEETDGRY